MAPEVLLAILAAVVLALFFDFTNGKNDSGNQIALPLKINAMKPFHALIIAATLNFIGAYFLGTAVAQTLGKGVIDPSMLQVGVSGVVVIICALCGAITWNFVTLYWGIPSSSSHALIGGLIGAFVAGWGITPVNWHKVGIIFAVLILAPIFSLGIAWLLTRVMFWICNRSSSLTPRFNKFLKILQYPLVGLMSLGHGSNDAQKTMGVIAFTLVIAGISHDLPGTMIIPQWVRLACASVIALGTLSGGWRIIKTMGWKIYDFRPIHSPAIQFSSALVICIASFFGYVVSTSQLISAAGMGSGASERPRMVHWDKAEEMVGAWLKTIPASATISAMLLFLFKGLWLYVIGMSLLGVAGYLVSSKIKSLKLSQGNSKKDFKQLLLEQIEVVLAGSELVVKYCFEPTRENAEAVDCAEKEADIKRRILGSNLNSRFMTGLIPRDDLDILSERIDNIMDELKKAVIRMSIYGIMPDEHIRREVSDIVESIVLLRDAIQFLGKDNNRCRECIGNSRKKENSVVHEGEHWYVEKRSDIKKLNIRPSPEEMAEISSEEKIRMLEDRIKSLEETIIQGFNFLNDEHGHTAFQIAANQVVAAGEKLSKILDKVS